MARNDETIFSDIDLNFKPNPVTGDIFKKTDINSIISALKNLLLTTNYEKPFSPEYGCGIRTLLFEPVDTITSAMIKKEIEQTVKNYEPRIQLQNVVVQSDAENNRYNIVMKFFISNNAVPVTISLFLERIR
jgi:phage baseplate assembly protein W